MRNLFLIYLGKLTSYIFRILRLGHGSTWPGHIALNTNKKFIREVISSNSTKIIVIAGTNGKTTTAKILRTILEKNGKRVLQNESGANLLNGIASTLLLASNSIGKLPYDFAIFEVDENALPHLVKEVTPDYLVLLNLFRDQLDRYGEVRSIATKWKTVLSSLPLQTTCILNAHDPEIAYLGKDITAMVKYYGINNEEALQEKQDHAVDSTYCPNCQSALIYTKQYYAHLGDWHCPSCSAKIVGPVYSHFSAFPLPGIYNEYNTLAAVLTASEIGITEIESAEALQDFTPAFGRQEKINYKGKNLQIFLSKNPTSFNQSLRTIVQQEAKHILIILNDRVADGHDVSWIWDTELEEYIHSFTDITLSGDRGLDMAIRCKYADIDQKNVKVLEDLEEAIEKSVGLLPFSETLYILPTYTAMLDVRKVVTGKRIL